MIGELLLTPVGISLIEHGTFDAPIALAESIIIVSFNKDDKSYTIEGRGSYEPSLIEILPGVFLGVATLGASMRAQNALYRPIAAGRSMKSIAINLHNKVVSSSEFRAYAEPAKKAKTLPANLIAKVQYSDKTSIIPNSTIDAGEDSIITVSVTNKGKGTAFDVKVKTETDYRDIDWPKSISIGDIQPGDTKEATITLKADLDIVSGKAPFKIYCKENRGYDSNKAKVIIPAAHLEKPDLVITRYDIDDSNTGLAMGNGNGIPESGETIELIAFIKNRGHGKAIGVNLVADEINAGIKWAKDRMLVGIIPPNEIVKAKIAFSIPRDFDANEILSFLSVSDIRGVSNAKKKVTLAYSKRAPQLQYAYRILSRGKEVASIINGEDFEIELTVKNKGQLSARNVVMAVTSIKDVQLDRQRIDMGMIKAQSSYPVQKIGLSVPRTFIEPQLPLNIKLVQSDFVPSEGVINIPINVKSPRLSYKTRLLSKGGGNTLEKGEGAILEIQILNEGSLSADAVKINIESRDENLSIIGKKEHIVGRILEKSISETIKFQVSTKRRISIGNKFLNIHISQNDFPSDLPPYALYITEEDMTVVDLASENEGKSSGKIALGSKEPPSIFILSPESGQTIDEDIVYLAVDVKDDRNVESIRVKVNGSVLPISDQGTDVQASKKREIRTKVELKEGLNRIVIYAYNSDNVKAIKEIRITRRPEEDVDSPPITNIKNPDAVAVVIGISRFKNPDIPTVDYAKRDAETMKEYLIHALGFKEKNVIKLYDEEALLADLKATIKTKLRKWIAPGRSDVFIFYSGHGVPDLESKEPYLVPYNFDPYAIEDTGYKLSEFYEHIDEIKARSVTVVIDACFSGSSPKGLIIKGISPVSLEVNNPAMKIKNAVVITSSTGQQVSSWYDKKQHGLFTYYFLLGLRGEADADKDKKITVEEMKKYLDANVSKQARKLHNREQEPQVMGNGERVLLKY